MPTPQPPPILSDENVPAPSTALLRAYGLDILSVREDHRGLSDPDVIALARRLGRVLITLDSDIGERIYRAGDAPPLGVIYLRDVQADPEDCARIVLALLDAPLLGRFTTVRTDRVRQRRLP